MKYAFPVTAAAAALLTACLAGCTTTTGGTAVPSATGAGPETGAPVNPDVPKVTQQPLDVAAYAGEPCKVVPPDTLAELRYTDPGEPHTGAASDTAAGPYCAWAIRGEGLGLHVSLLTGNREKGSGGLAGVYAAKDSGRYAFVDRAPDVDGYPAVYADVRDRRQAGNCTMYVGIADDLTFGVATSGYPGEDGSCAAAQKAAVAVVKTLKGA